MFSKVKALTYINFGIMQISRANGMVINNTLIKINIIYSTL